MLALFRNNNKATSTPLSRFVNGTPPRVKKRIYQRVLIMATDAQKKVLLKAKTTS